ncbi:MAG TPA: DUF4265 domain-containing protein [Gemmatimonadaceae bacterium]|nr:DUF4265 domain-containing protein [Gemmatimonadaceae bacterium]
MTKATENAWHQMRFVSPEGRVEVLWVEASPDVPSGYRILNVPVWLYDISIGTVVEGRHAENGQLEFVRVLSQASGGTVRVITAPAAPDASRLYLDRILRDCHQRQIMIGPATFFDPRLVAIHVQDWDRYCDQLVQYLQDLRATNDIQEWEIADPAEPSDQTQEAPRPGPGLIHPRPSARQAYAPLPDAAT